MRDVNLKLVGDAELKVCEAEVVGDLRQFAIDYGWGNTGAVEKVVGERRVAQLSAAPVELNATYEFVPARDPDRARLEGDPVHYMAATPAVSRVMTDAACVGTATAVAFEPDNVLIVTALHCLQEGKTLLPATAFGGQTLRFVLANPCHDMAVFQVDRPPERALQASSQSSHVGQRVNLMAYPQAVDAEIQGHADDHATYCQGCVVRTYATSHIVLADYKGGMPNTSGAPVLDNVGHYAGMHVGTVWHLSPTEGHGEDASVDPPNVTIFDAENIWVAPSSSAGSDDTEQDISARLERVDLSSKHAVENIREKESLATLVPLSTILNVLIEAGKMSRLLGSVAGHSMPRKRKHV